MVGSSNPNSSHQSDSKHIYWCNILKQTYMPMCLNTLHQMTTCIVLHHRINMPINLHFEDFYSASAWLAMQSAVLARGIPSVCPSVTFRYCVKTNEDTIVRFSASGRTIPLVCREVKFIRIFTGITPSGGVKVRHPSIDRENSTNNRP